MGWKPMPRRNRLASWIKDLDRAELLSASSLPFGGHRKKPENTSFLCKI
jgi:hypothetical protein